MSLGASLWEVMHPAQVKKEKAFKKEGEAKSSGKETPSGSTPMDTAIAKSRDEEVGK